MPSTYAPISTLFSNLVEHLQALLSPSRLCVRTVVLDVGMDGRRVPKNPVGEMLDVISEVLL